MERVESLGESSRPLPLGWGQVRRRLCNRLDDRRSALQPSSDHVELVSIELEILAPQEGNVIGEALLVSRAGLAESTLLPSRDS